MVAVPDGGGCERWGLAEKVLLRSTVVSPGLLSSSSGAECCLGALLCLRM